MISEGKRAIVASVLLLFVFSCATTQDATVTYLTTRDTFNAALENYSERVKAMPEGADKTELKEKFNPIWKDAAEALDGWGNVVKGVSTEDPAASVREFSAAKNALIKLGMKHFGESLFSDAGSTPTK